MRILLTLDFPPEDGGIQQYLWGLVKHSYGARDQVIVGAYSRVAECPPGLPCTVRYVTTKLSRVNKKWSLLALFVCLTRLWMQKRSDMVVECGNVFAAVVPWVLSWVTPVRYRVYTYGTELLGLKSPKPQAHVLRRVLRGAQLLYTLGPYTERLLRDRDIGTFAVQIAPRIELGSETNVTERAKEPLGVYRILCVGRLVPHKGHSVLLDAVSALKDFTWQLTIIGNGPERQSLMRQSRSLQIDNSVRFLSGIDRAHLAQAYCEADLFVLPSLETKSGTEGFGIVLLEAMAASVPVIASRVGGIPDVLDNGTCGILVTPGSAGQLAAAISDLRRAPLGGAEMAQRARRRLMDKYVWK